MAARALAAKFGAAILSNPNEDNEWLKPQNGSNTSLYAQLASYLPVEADSSTAGFFISCKHGASLIGNAQVLASWVHNVSPRALGRPCNIMDLFRTKAASKFSDDELYIAVGHLLKLGVDVNDACKAEAAARQGASSGSNSGAASTSDSSAANETPDASRSGSGRDTSADAVGVHEVAWLVHRVATRTLAQLIKARPACEARVNEYPTLRAAVRSNSEYTLLNLVARGADFNPYLKQLTQEAVRYCCHKTLPWLLQWQECTHEHMLELLQTATPTPANASCADVAGLLEVLLTHGLDPHTSLTNAAGVTQPLLLWGVEFAVAALNLGTTAAAAVAASTGGMSRAGSSGGLSHGAGGAGGSSQTAAAAAAASSATGASRTASTSGTTSSTIGSTSSTVGSTDGSTSGSTDPGQRYGAVELLQVLLKCGAGDGGSKAGALVLAARGLRAELVAELVKAGADPSGTGVDLLAWAMDRTQCPASSGVLEALLAVHRAEQEAQRLKAERAARMAAAAARRGVGRAAGSVGVVARAPGVSTTAPVDADGSPSGALASAAAAGPARVTPMIIASSPFGPSTCSPAHVVRPAASNVASPVPTIRPINGGGTPVTTRSPSPTLPSAVQPTSAGGSAATAATATATAGVTAAGSPNVNNSVVACGAPEASGGAPPPAPQRQASSPTPAPATAAVAATEQSPTQDIGTGGTAGSKGSTGGMTGSTCVPAVLPSGRQAARSLLPAALLRELRRDSALVEAVGRNDLHAVQCLLDAGADVHHKQDKALLLAMGAIDPDTPDRWMPRPRDRAPVLSMSRPIVELLLSRGADVNAREGRAVVQAARWKDTYSLAYLESLGADMSVLQANPAWAALWPPKERVSSS